MIHIPPRDERLCHRHGIPMSPSRWRSGHRHTDCAQCRNQHASKKKNNLARSTARGLVNPFSKYFELENLVGDVGKDSLTTDQFLYDQQLP